MGIHQTVTISEMMTQLSDSSKSIVQKLIDQADYVQLKQKLDLLGEKCKQLLTLFAEGYTDKEIAAETEYKTGEVVKTSRIRCLEKLRLSFKRT